MSECGSCTTITRHESLRWGRHTLLLTPSALLVIAATTKGDRLMHQNTFAMTKGDRRVHQNTFTTTKGDQEVHQNTFATTKGDRRVHQNMFATTCSDAPVYLLSMRREVCDDTERHTATGTERGGRRSEDEEETRGSRWPPPLV